ncbi:DUF6252 family protein [Flavobacterium selenitireducens]|uniref:DUF6252 family protein n=1 Tax=Flavobacterium selenitireducens TaxID=2722704 RepID=UPI00168B0EBB|nr:DUF6252 family protein [Flavobacterium selenitireducens]MBD3582009.1 hypothetical protein [Flavobacterium selenitireducens]
MKKIFLLLFSVVALSSCTEDVRDNSPAFEGLRNGSRWRAPGVTATVGAGGDLTISGGNQFETLTLMLPTTDAGTYTLGTSQSRKAMFVIIGDSGTKTYATGTGIGNGEIEIEVYDEVNKTITGTFRFNAIAEDAVDPTDPTAAETINFIEGNFYKVPVRPSL